MNILPLVMSLDEILGTTSVTLASLNSTIKKKNKQNFTQEKWNSYNPNSQPI